MFIPVVKCDTCVTFCDMEIKNATQPELADVFGTSAQWVKTLCTQGVLVKGADGHFNLAENCKRYIAHLRAKADSDATVSHKERLTAAQADMAEMELEQACENWIPVSEVVVAWDAALISFRQSLLGLPSKLVQAHPDLRPDIAATLNAEVRQVLTDLAGADVGARGRPGKSTAKRKRGRPRKVEEIARG